MIKKTPEMIVAVKRDLMEKEREKGDGLFSWALG